MKETKNIMPLIQLLEVLIVGVLLWLVNRFIPMQASIKSILNGVVVIAVVLWLLNGYCRFNFSPGTWPAAKNESFELTVVALSTHA